MAAPTGVSISGSAMQPLMALVVRSMMLTAYPLLLVAYSTYAVCLSGVTHGAMPGFTPPASAGALIT